MINRSVLALVMMVGAAGAMGCNGELKSAVEDMAKGDKAASSEDESLGSTADAARVWARGWVGPTRWSWATHAPPAHRYEYYGRAPSSRHFWVHGYHRWSGREYIWVGGHWDMRRNGRTYVQPHYDYVDGQYRFIPGHWA